MEKNLLIETVEMMDLCGKSFEDIAFIGSSDGKYGISTRDFISLSNFTYSKDIGNDIYIDLIVVFKNGDRLERIDMGAYTEWDIVESIKPPEDYIKIDSLSGFSFDDLN